MPKRARAPTALQAHYHQEARLDEQAQQEENINNSKGQRTPSLWKRNAWGQVLTAAPAARWTADEVATLQESLQNVLSAHQMTDNDDNTNTNTNTTDQLFGTAHQRVAGRGGRKDKSLWFQVAQAFPHRSVEMVYKKAFRMHQNATRKTGPWTADESRRLPELIALHGHKWAHIGQLLNRNADAVFDQYRLLKHGHYYYWSAAEKQQLREWVTKYQKKRKNNKDNNHHHHDDDDDNTNNNLPWTKIAQKIGTKAAAACQNQWDRMQKQQQQQQIKETTEPINATAKKNQASSREKGTKSRAASRQRQWGLVPRPKKTVDRATTTTSLAAPPPSNNNLTALHDAVDVLLQQQQQHNNNNLHTTTVEQFMAQWQAQFPEFPLDAHTRQCIKERLIFRMAQDMLEEEEEEEGTDNDDDNSSNGTDRSSRAATATQDESDNDDEDEHSTTNNDYMEEEAVEEEDDGEEEEEAEHGDGNSTDHSTAAHDGQDDVDHEDDDNSSDANQDDHASSHANTNLPEILEALNDIYPYLQGSNTMDILQQLQAQYNDDSPFDMPTQQAIEHRLAQLEGNKAENQDDDVEDDDDDDDDSIKETRALQDDEDVATPEIQKSNAYVQEPGAPKASSDENDDTKRTKDKSEEHRIMHEIAQTMGELLQQAPKRKMKQKALRRAVRAKHGHLRKSIVKEMMRKILSSPLEKQGAVHSFQVDGKKVKLMRNVAVKQEEM